MPNAIGTNVIGPNFGAELTAAGLQNGVAWDLTSYAFSYEPTLSAAELAAIEALFARHNPTLPAGGLPAYAAAQRYARETGGITVALGGSGGVAVATDEGSQAKIMGAQAMVALNPAFTTTWKAADGSFVPLTSATITAIATAVGAHVAACFAAEASVDAGIKAGTITTTAQIDAAFAAVTP